MDIYKSLYSSYYWASDKIKGTNAEVRKYILIAMAFVLFLIYRNIGTILWWSVLFILGYYLWKAQKQNASNIDKEMEDICRDKPDLDICKIYNQSKNNHTKIIESIRDKLGN
jgi:hypothetical protein